MSNVQKNFYAKGRLKSGEMNQTEKDYANFLELKRQSCEIQWYKFEGVKFRLADNTFYTPDFVVLRDDGFMECHEVKGYWLDDARAKIKIAADLYPFKFIGIKKKAKKDGGGWIEEVF